MDEKPRRRRGGRARGRSSRGAQPRGPRDRVRSERPVRTELCELAPFPVFCALYLGITETDGYAPQTFASVARRFGLSETELRAYLSDHELDRDAIERSELDLESASYDIKVAPDGVSRTELARAMFKEYLASR